MVASVVVVALEGPAVGLPVGLFVSFVGLSVGAFEGLTVGPFVGLPVGNFVGLSVTISGAVVVYKYNNNKCEGKFIFDQNCM